MILEQTLEQTKQSFPVPKTWVVSCLAPTPVSAIEIEPLILCAGFPDFAISSTRKTGIFFQVITDVTTNLIETPDLRVMRPDNRGRF